MQGKQSQARLRRTHLSVRRWLDCLPQRPIRGFASASGGVPARASGRDVILLLPPGLVEELEKKIAAVRAAEPVADVAPAK